MTNPITLYDSLVIIFYLIIVLAIGLYSRNKDKNTTDYFLAGKNLGWFVIGISIFATNISSEHFMGLAGSGASRGLAVGQFELIAIFFLVILGWIIAPIYKNANIFTTPEYLEKRFDASSRKFFSALSIFTYIITKVLVTLFAGGILFNKLFGFSIFSSAIIIVLITGIYSVVGGFSAVVRTQVFQGLVLVISTIVLTFFALNEVGGISALRAKLPGEYFQMFKSIDDPEFPWTGIIFGAPIIAFWYWCADQYIVQRVLGARTINEARRGTLLTAFLKIFPIFLLVLPGIAAVALFPGIKGDDAYPTLLASDILPIGVKGLVIAGFLAAIMSSLSAAFNSIAALYTIDFYKPKHPEASDRALVLVGRMTTIIIVILVILLVPFVKIINSQIYIFLQSTQAFISAPITAVFLLGLTVKKINARSAFLTLIIGEAIGVSRFVVELLMKSEVISNPLLLAFAKINYLHFTIFLFLGSSILLLMLSYIFNTEIVNTKLIQNLTVGGFDNSVLAESKSKKQFRINIMLSSLLLIVVIGLFSLFN